MDCTCTGSKVKRWRLEVSAAWVWHRSKMKGWKENWSRTVGSREGIGVYVGFGDCRKCTGALMIGSAGSAGERK